jgi:hypothetical protein
VSPSPSTYTRRNNSLSISHLGDLKSSLSSLILFSSMSLPSSSALLFIPLPAPQHGQRWPRLCSQST